MWLWGIISMTMLFKSGPNSQKARKDIENKFAESINSTLSMIKAGDSGFFM